MRKGGGTRVTQVTTSLRTNGQPDSLLQPASGSEVWVCRAGKLGRWHDHLVLHQVWTLFARSQSVQPDLYPFHHSCFSVTKSSNSQGEAIGITAPTDVLQGTWGGQVSLEDRPWGPPEQCSLKSSGPKTSLHDSTPECRRRGETDRIRLGVTHEDEHIPGESLTA